MKSTFLACAAITCLGATTAKAEPALADQVEQLEIKKSAFEAELESNFVAPAGAEERTAAYIFTGEYGLTDRLSIGLEIHTEAQAGGPLNAETALLEVKYIALDPREHGVGFGAQAGLGPSLDGGEGEAELVLIAEKTTAHFAVAGNLQFETSLGPDPERAIRYGLRGEMGTRFGSLGVEAGGDLDSGPENARHWVGPLAVFELRERAAIELSYLRGLNDETPTDQVRLQLTFICP